MAKRDCSTRINFINLKWSRQSPTNRNRPSQLVNDSFPCFQMVYPVKNTGAKAIIFAVDKWINYFQNPHSILHDRRTAFIRTRIHNLTWKVGITLQPRTANSTWNNRKDGTQHQHFQHSISTASIQYQQHQPARYWCNSLNDAGINWSSPAPKLFVAHNTNVLHYREETLRNNFFYKDPNPKISEAWILPQNKQKLCCWDFCNDLPPPFHSKNNWNNQLPDNLIRLQLFQSILERKTWLQTNLQCHIGRMSGRWSHAYRNGPHLWQHPQKQSKKLYKKIIVSIFPNVRSSNYNKLSLSRFLNE